MGQALRLAGAGIRGPGFDAANNLRDAALRQPMFFSQLGLREALNFVFDKDLLIALAGASSFARFG